MIITRHYFLFRATFSHSLRKLRGRRFNSYVIQHFKAMLASYCLEFRPRLPFRKAKRLVRVRGLRKSFFF